MAVKLHIKPIPAFEDNYIWLLHNGREAIVVDPGDANPVIEILEAQSLKLTTILITHHHADHIGGVKTLLKQYQARVYAPRYKQYAFQHTPIGEGEQFTLAEHGLTLKTMWLPGHTLDHIAFYNDQWLFCGDVLFGAGCGRLFEGTNAQMLDALNRLKALPDQTAVYCTHEYTTKNIDFALTLEPDNQDLLQRKRNVAELRRQNIPSLPSTIGLERKTNPFLRCNQTAIIERSKSENKDELSVFSKIRSLRNHY